MAATGRAGRSCAPILAAQGGRGAGGRRLNRRIEPSAPADGSDDFQPVARVDGGIGIAAAGNDLAVSLDGDPPAFEGERANHVGDGGDRAGKRARCR